VSAHEAGALHAPGYGGTAVVPAWLRPPGDPNDLLQSLWATSVKRTGAGVLEVGGIDVRDLAERFGTPAYVVDEADFRARAAAFRDAFALAFAEGSQVSGVPTAGGDVYYAGKAFLCTAVARWIVEEGLNLDVCTGGELAVALRAGVPGARIGLHGNNKSVSEIERALRADVGRIVLDSLAEIDRVADVAARLGVVAPVMIRVTVGVEAHTHEYIATAHEDQKFGLSLSGGVAAEAVRQVLARPDQLRLLGLHSHIGSQIFDTAAFELSARRLLGLHALIEQEHGLRMPEIDLGGGFGIAYTSEHDPLEAKSLAGQLAAIVARECGSLGIAVPRVSVEPGRAIAGPSTFTLYTVGTVKPVEIEQHATRTYVSVDGGMSDNIRTALYDADYSCTLASRTSGATPMLARVVGKHCESGDIIVRDEFLPGDVEAGDLLAVPGTGAYCRSMASQYNHVPRPPVVAVADGAARVIVRRETEDDLLALDTGL
jgi:diaminopimelate decarboxylase